MKRAVLLLTLVPGLLAAQFESALLSKIPFNVTNPGGKSLAMGGAFTAIADDATAALANPAGLGLLSSIEVGVSLKRFDSQIDLATARATATGSPFNAPYPPVRARSSGLSDTQSAVEYAGVVVPLSSRFVVALTYAENLGFRADPGEDGYTYIELRDNRSGGGTIRRDILYEIREYGAVELKNRLLGLSLAYRVNERLRLGLGVTMSRMSFDLLGDAGGPHRVVNRTFVSALQIQRRTLNVAVEGLDGEAFGAVVGAQADLLPRGLLTAGLSARFAGRHEGRLVLSGDVSTQIPADRSFSFGVPDDVSFGLASQPLPGLTVAIEGQWVRYANVSGTPLPVGSYEAFVAGSDFRATAIADLSRGRNVLVPRAGVEYVAAADRLRLAFRVGYHREPSHGVMADLVARDASGTPYDLFDPPFSSSVRQVFDGGQSDDRFSGGVGATLDGRISLDLSFDLGRSSRQLAASVFYRF